MPKGLEILDTLLTITSCYFFVVVVAYRMFCSLTNVKRTRSLVLYVHSLCYRGGGIANTYQRRADILNRGMSGYNTRWYLRYAQDNGIWEEEDNDNVVLITIFFGANDASLEKENPHAHVPLDEYKQNIQTMIAKCSTHYPKAKVICMTPPPVHHEQRLIFQKQRYADKATGVLERTLTNTGKYAQAVINISSELNIPCLDLYNTMQVPPPPPSPNGDAGDVDKTITEYTKSFDFGMYLCDGLHFSKTGHEFVLRSLLKLIETKLPELHVTPDKFTNQWNNSGTTCTGIMSSGPYHDHINHDSYEEAFNKDYKEKKLGGNEKQEEPDTKRPRQE